MLDVRASYQLEELSRAAPIYSLEVVLLDLFGFHNLYDLNLEYVFVGPNKKID